jgi:hypothetical protein
MDFCRSAGGGLNPIDPGTGWYTGDAVGEEDLTWASAFNILPDVGLGLGSGSFVGWNGNMVCGTDADGQNTAWLYWRENFYQALMNGVFTWQAVNEANNDTLWQSCAPVDILPWDTGREVWSGDLIGTVSSK